MSERAEAPHLPHPAPIDAYGNGGFRFAGMSHRGSILCMPSGIWAWPIGRPGDIDERSLAPVLARGSDIEFFLLGAGCDIWVMPEPVRWRFRDRRIGVEIMTTGAALHTYNIVLAEGRRVAAGLIAVD
jgi:uncharacterized protein